VQVNITEDETKSFIAEFEGTDRGVVELIKEKVAESKDVEFASVEKDHPEHAKVRLVVKSTRNAKALVLKAIEELQEEVKELSAQIPKK
jgi:DNA-directed RNA polymerase subunit L